MVSYPLIAEDAKPPGGQLLAALHPNLGIAAQYQRKLAALIDAMHAEMLAIINLSATSPHSPRACSRPWPRSRACTVSVPDRTVAFMSPGRASRRPCCARRAGRY